LETYKTKYIDPLAEVFAKKAANTRLVLIIEPDSLPNLVTNMKMDSCTASADGYKKGIAYAISKFASIPNTFMYLDIAHGGWLGWPQNTEGVSTVMSAVLKDAQALNPAAAKAVVGFATNVANYSPVSAGGKPPATEKTMSNGMYDGNPAIDETIYITNLVKVFQGVGLPTRFLIDTSRNGQAGIRKSWGSWCNIKNSGIGTAPAVDPQPNVDAYMWIKPPGDSDGNSEGAPRLDKFCDPTTSFGQDSLSGAPQAGVWFQSEFEMLVKNANPALC
jgi:cellulose 1,4-beta-cellobiosidase